MDCRAEVLTTLEREVSLDVGRSLATLNNSSSSR